MTTRLAHGACQAAAAVAWIVAAAWFWLMLDLAWGFAPSAMLFWSIPAFPLSVLTTRWLSRLNQPLSHRPKRLVVAAWATLLVLQLPLWFGGDNPIWDSRPAEAALVAMMALSYALPLLVTAWALYPIGRARRTEAA